MRRRHFMQLAALASAGLTAAPAARAQTSPVKTGQLYAITYRAGPAWRAGRPMREQDLIAHGRRMQRLFEAGVVFAAGPLGEDGGLVLALAADAAEAATLVAEDPAVIAGVFVAEAKPWRPRFRSNAPLPA